MKLNDIIKKLFTAFSKEVAKDVSKLQNDIVNLKPKSGANPPTNGDHISTDICERRWSYKET